MLGLPDAITTCLFDLDGVLTDTASVHTKAWKHTFDAYLRARAERTGTHFVPFDPGADGVRTFLRSRDIELPEGEPDDPPEAETVRGLGNRKNEELLRSIERDGVEVYAGSRRFLRAAQDAGLRRVVVSSSANTAAVLKATGLAALIEARVDGRTIEAEHLAGKPAPDTFVAGARLVGATPLQAAVFEDAIAGVQAGRAGNFGFVVGVNRHGDDHHRQLREQGADVVVADLAELLSHHAGSRPARQPGGHPSTEGPDT